jgi:hypothetical protein
MSTFQSCVLMLGQPSFYKIWYVSFLVILFNTHRPTHVVKFIQFHFRLHKFINFVIKCSSISSYVSMLGSCADGYKIEFYWSKNSLSSAILNLKRLILLLLLFFILFLRNTFQVKNFEKALPPKCFVQYLIPPSFPIQIQL